MKEQCLELILNVMPLSQFVFVFVMAVILDRVGDGKATSTIDALRHLGLEDLFGLDAGLFWKVSILVLGGAFFLALFNTFLIKSGLKHSFARSNISAKLAGWTNAASLAVKKLSPEDKASIQKSISAELEKRVKKYHAKRMLAETMCSVVSCIVFGSMYVAFIICPDWSKLTWSVPDLVVLVISLFAWVMLHRSSVGYAISKVIPLQVYLSASTGEIAFYINAE